jgi:hypothetical protein
MKLMGLVEQQHGAPLPRGQQRWLSLQRIEGKIHVTQQHIPIPGQALRKGHWAKAVATPEAAKYRSREKRIAIASPGRPKGLEHGAAPPIEILAMGTGGPAADPIGGQAQGAFRGQLDHSQGQRRGERLLQRSEKGPALGAPRRHDPEPLLPSLWERL